MSQHTTQMRLDAAFRANAAAQQACPHWDYENPDGLNFPCCQAWHTAHTELRRAAKALEKETT